MVLNAARMILLRETPTPAGPNNEFLKLLQDPFSSSLQQTSIWAAVVSSLGTTVGIALAFSFLRPYNTVVYAPKLKHADEKHAPPPIGKGMFAWIGPLWKTTEKDMVNLVGMDATIFMRFTRMCRNMLVTLALIGCCVLIPVNASQTVEFANESWLYKITPSNVWGTSHWATAAVAWLFNLVIAGFLWWNYRHIVRLRREYFKTIDYQQSLHARTLMLYDIPKKASSDEGIARIIDSVVPNSSFSRTAIARDVKILPELISEHNKIVRKLEKVLAIYLKDPQNLPHARPVCKPSKKDRAYDSYPKGQKVDAIEYLTDRIKSLELEIKEVRLSVDKRSSMPYGFASYSDISEAHAIAYTCRKQKLHDATVVLAPRPSDIIWDNMPLSAASRSARRLWNKFWVLVLTFLWVVPNALIAIFLVNLANLGRVWHAFQIQLSANHILWSIIQGIASPAVTSLIYLLLPIVFRRLAIRAGDQTKTGRERHVTATLYSFFVFNNLFVFSMFSAIWSFSANVVQRTNHGTDAWSAILKEDFFGTAFITLCVISPFWITWLLQRQLGAVIDLAQLWTLLYSFVMRKFSSPTPRELIELTAPPPFDYASYYNYFLYYMTVTLCFSSVQPLVLPAAAMYFCIDIALKKYLLLYVFVTKTESGGMFWRLLFNRVVFATVLSNLVFFLVCWVRGAGTHYQAYAVAPLPFLMVGFKIYCARVFDNKLQYYSTVNLENTQAEPVLNVKEESLRSDRLAAKFGHPALYKPLITPMVHAKAQNILASVYQGRLTDGRDAGSGDLISVSGYSDTYAMNAMKSGKAGKVAGPSGFEIVPESRLDFEYYKNRDEFAADHGAGELFGTPSDIVRTGTPSIANDAELDFCSRPGTPAGGMGFASHRGMAGGGMSYQQQTPGYHQQAPASNFGHLYGRQRSDSAANLMRNAEGMPNSPPFPVESVGNSGSDWLPSGSIIGGLGLGSPRAPGILGGGPQGYGGLPQDDDTITPMPSAQSPDPMQYDYFRGSRAASARDPSGL